MEDYKARLHATITDLQQATKRGLLSRERRFEYIEAVMEEYFRLTGEMPDAKALERLADLCLYEELFNPSLTKMQDEEYPIMSDRQYERRQNTEFATGKRLDQNAADGQEHGRPIRRNRSDYENRFLDKKAKIRNKERKKAYSEFTKVQPVVVRKMSK
jgi:hypothetical protein